MGTRKQLTRALMASAAIIAGAAGAASAQENTAGNVVENTFTLDYAVGGTPQTGITNDPDAPGGRTVQGSETTFTVDRRVDLAVTALTGPVAAAPGQNQVSTFFSVVNEGNDNFRYTLAATNNTTNTGTIDPNDNARDNFDYANAPTYAWYVPANGTCSTTVSDYNTTGASVTTDIPADGTVCVRVVTDVPAGTTDTAQSGVYLTATAVQPGAWANATEQANNAPTAGGALTADADGNDIDAAENVFLDADGAGPADGNRDAAHTDQSFVLVSAADLSATKSVFAVATNGNDCDTLAVPTSQPNGQYAVPGACMIYVIEVQNRGGNAATDIDLTDVLPAGLTFVGADAATFGGASKALAIPTVGQDCTANTCTVALTDAELAAGTAANPTTGQLVIRATLNTGS